MRLKLHHFIFMTVFLALGIAVYLFLSARMPQTQSQEKTKITFWTTPIMPEEDMKAIVEQYNAQSEEAEIEMVYIPFFRSDERINVALSTDSFPDVYLDGSVRLGPLSKRMIAQPLDAYIPEEYNLKDITPGTLDMCKIDGELTILPLAVNPFQGTLLVNRTLFEEAGVQHLLPNESTRAWSREDFAQAVLTISDPQNSVYGLGLAAGAYDHDKFVDNYIYNDGTSYVSDDGKTAVYNSPENVTNLTWLVNLVNSQAALPGSASMQDSTLLDLFLEGKVAVINNNIGYCEQIRKVQESGSKIDMMIAHYPTWDGSVGNMWMSIYGVVVSRQSSEEKMRMAADFAVWLTNGKSEEVNESLYVQGEQLPVRKSLRWCISDPELQVLSMMPEQTIGNIFIIPDYQRLRQIWCDLFQKALISEISPKEALDAFNEQIQLAIN